MSELKVSLWFVALSVALVVFAVGFAAGQIVEDIHDAEDKAATLNMLDEVNLKAQINRSRCAPYSGSRRYPIVYD